MSIYQQYFRRVEMEGGSNLEFRQSATVVGPATMDEPLDYSMKTLQPCTTPHPEEAGQYQQEEEDQNLRGGDTCLGKNGADLYKPKIMQGKNMTDLQSQKAQVPQGLPLRGKVHVTNVPAAVVEEQPTMCNDEFIDIGAAKKKVIPADVKDEEIHPAEIPEIAGVQRRVSHKRPSTAMQEEDEEWPSLSQAQLKFAVDVVTKICDNKSIQPLKLIFNRKKFSGFESLVPDEDGVANSGSFGSVFKGVDRQTHERLVWKKVKRVEKNEVLIPLHFPNQDSIAQVYGFQWDGKQATIVQEDAGLSLRQLISGKGECPQLAEPDAAEKILYDVLRGVNLLATHGITHCDIKPENVCLNPKTGKAKLIDLGSCKTRQDCMNYSGITPEYLPPGPNNFITSRRKTPEKPTPMPSLGEKDDVWAAGLVGLYLLIGRHPMIQWATGAGDYTGNAEEVQKKRYDVMEKISQLCDAPSDSPYSMENVLGTLLTCEKYTSRNLIVELLLKMVLVVNESKRMTSADAVLFLKKYVETSSQPPRKAQKLRELKAEALDNFVDLKLKNPELQASSCNSKVPLSPPIDPRQGLGVALKAKRCKVTLPGTQQTGNILAPVKFFYKPRQQGEPLQYDGPWNNTPPEQVAPPAPTTPPEPSVPPPSLMVRADNSTQVYQSMQEEQEHDAEYNNLVKFFTNQSQGSYSHAEAQLSAAHQSSKFQFRGCREESGGFMPQSSAFSQPDVDVHQSQPDDRDEQSPMDHSVFAPSGGRATLDEFQRNFALSPFVSSEQRLNGNVPAMEMLMDDLPDASVDRARFDNRRKLKGIRRLKSKQD